MEFVFKRRWYTPEAPLPPEYGEYFYFFEIDLVFKDTLDWKDVTHRFQFDTGAPISYAPERILNDLMGIEPAFEYDFWGINRAERCKIRTKVAHLTFKILDEDGNESPELEGWFAFHHYNSPSLFGLEAIFGKLGFQLQLDDDTLILNFSQS
ncbi:MAG TPA: hypothetical protein VKK79_12375 [Candidatus Lokiarchaeia archaeon]|nr:hypothetical protein [Candidatus Lokiarchaeia archaeon]